MRILRSQTAEKGFSLLESVLAIGILGVVAVAFFGGLATGARAGAVTDKQTTAENYARSQMEYVKNCAYITGADDYPVDPGIVLPPSWTILPAAAEPLHTPDDGIQKITVTVQQNGVTVFTMSGYKTN